MIVIGRTTVFAALTAIVLAACVTLSAPTPTTTPEPLVPEPIGRWVLDRIIEDGQEEPPFGYDLPFEFIQWIRFKGDGSFEGYDGCNSIWGRFTFDRSGSLDVGGEVGEISQTAVGCPVVIDVETGQRKSTVDAWPLTRGYVYAIMDVSTYEIRDDELWLFHSADKSNVLVFQRAGATD